MYLIDASNGQRRELYHANSKDEAFTKLTAHVMNACGVELKPGQRSGHAQIMREFIREFDAQMSATRECSIRVGDYTFQVVPVS